MAEKYVSSPGVSAAESARRADTNDVAAPWGPHRGPLTVDDDFSVLDDPLEQRDFTQTVDGPAAPVQESVLMVQGMYCAACADAVEAALAAQPGVLEAQVHAATRRLVLRWDPARVRLSELARAVGRAGYRLLPMRHALAVSARVQETRQALWRLFVAGFCMMQVMMYTWPEYVTTPGQIPPDIVQLLRWASWVLSLPVMLFASGPFFTSAWRDLRQGRIGMDVPVSIGILVTFVVSSLATFEPGGPWGSDVWFDSLTMFVFFLLGGRYLEFRLRDRTAGALDALMNRLPEQVQRERPDGTLERVSLKRLQIGDVVRIEAGQAFPGDATVLSDAATVDEALLTGESHPVTRRQGDSVVAGSYNVAGTVRVRIDRLGRETRFGQIVALMEQASTERPRLARLADRVAAPFLGLVLLAAALSAWGWWSVDPHRAVATAVAVLIVTCPCALSLATPAAMLAAAGALAQRGVLTRRLQAFEALAAVDTVVFDKTGTLTQDRVVVHEVHTRPGWDAARALQVAARMAQASLHPVSRAIVARAGAVEAPWVVQESPGRGLTARDPQGQTWRLGSAAHCGLDERALAAAGRSVPDMPCAYLADEAGWVATFVLDEGVRADARAAVQRLRALGVQVWLLSGDRLGAAQRVARPLGIEHVIAGASPEDKLVAVQRWQAEGHRVAMVGDGMNDAPVLARADVSFALGHGAPLTQTRADFVVQSARLSDVVAVLEHARATLRVVRQNLAWAAGYNAVSVPLALLGWMPPWAAGLGMAASSLLVIGNAMRLSRLPDAAETASALPAVSAASTPVPESTV
ncbi:heavy metal translocating P-type ATPase [Tepidimonas charontis]|uniref:Putative copper-importing P-type ATPase A n=1 Tax=Tepidimonas charontis TaxID=2267262 RepID=A0A554XGF6_9BURK|nr:cation-translocating P-type ATPase [Tepidimonas charontis]TSE34913.1 putative copper-importing P-type ATPase A [Tepidimonas charontis]